MGWNLLRLVDNVVLDLLKRVLQASSFTHVNLDHVVLGKPGYLASFFPQSRGFGKTTPRTQFLQASHPYYEGVFSRIPQSAPARLLGAISAGSAVPPRGDLELG